MQMPEQQSNVDQASSLMTTIKEFVDEKNKHRTLFDRSWTLKILYYMGHQWLEWDRYSHWRDNTKIKDWVPRPVTNRFASTADSLIGNVMRSEIDPTVWPASEAHEDVAAAAVAERLIPMIDQEVDSNTIREDVVSWMTLNGTCILFDYYDKLSKDNGEMFIQSLQCLTCGNVAQPADFEQGCQVCGSQYNQPATNEAGEPVEEAYLIGRLMSKALSPLQVYMDIGAGKLPNLYTFCVVESLSQEEIFEKWGVEAEKSEGGSEVASWYMKILAMLSEARAGLGGRATSEGVLVYTYAKPPCPSEPEGLFVKITGDEKVLEGPSEYPFYEDNTKVGRKYFCPLTLFKFNNVPGRVYGKTPLSDIVHKQDQINRLESLIELAIIKGTYGTWLLPAGSSIQRISGEPGKIIRWTPTGSSGNPPQNVTTTPFPPMLIEWKRSLEQDIEDVSGSVDVLKGDTPKGVSAGYAVSLLTERAITRLNQPLRNWERGWVQATQKRLMLAKTYWTEQRLMMARGDTGRWETQKFSGADITGGIDVKIEGGSAKPKSKIGEQASVEMLINQGVLNPGDPQQAFEIAKIFGMSHILGHRATGTRAAAKEWGDFLQQKPPIVRMFSDDHVVHIDEHRKICNTDAFLDLPMELQQVWQEHIMKHYSALLQLQGLAQGGLPEQNGGGGAGPGIDSKAAETEDRTMDTAKQGGNSTLGSGG